MKRIAIAYFWLVFVASMLAFLVWQCWSYFHPRADFWFVWSIFLMVVHIRAYFVADSYFQKKLGFTNSKIGAVGGSRPVPIGGVFEAVLPGVTRQAKKQVTVDLSDGPESYVVGDIILPAERVDYFVKKAWSRQRSGSSGLSRPFWLKSHRPVWDRADYEAVISLLADRSLVSGRRPGASGKLILPAEPLLKRLRADFS